MGEKKILLDQSVLENELKSLLKTKELEREFYEGYYESRDKLYLSILKFREDQIEKDNMDEFQFIAMYTVNKQEALERLFVYPISKNEIKLLDIELESDRMSLSQLFKLKQLHKKRRLLRLLFSTTQ